MTSTSDIDGLPESCESTGVAKPRRDTSAPATPPKTLGQRIRATRLERGMTAVALAESVRARPHSLWRWESDQLTPRPETLLRIASVLGVSVDWLLLGDGTGVPEDSADATWAEFTATGGAAFYRARGVTDEQLEHVRRMPWPSTPAVSDYVRVLEALAAGAKRTDE